MTVTVTQTSTNLLTTAPEATVHISQSVAQAMGNTNPNRRVTELFGQVMCKVQASDNLKITQAYAQVMMDFTPNFEWIEMFVNEVFPYDISYNSIGATRFATDVIIVDSGDDQRNSRWDQPLMEYDVAYGVRTLEQLHGLTAFFRAMRGRKHAFLYRDVMDHSSTIAMNPESRRAPEISAVDQLLGIGDDVTKTFQLVKHYPTPGSVAESVRPIYKPKEGSVIVALDGDDAENWTLDYATGLLTFTPRLIKSGLSGVSLTHVNTNSWMISCDPGTFDGFIVNEKIVTTGWAAGANNTTEAHTLRITAIAPDKSSITISTPSTFGVAASGAAGITVQSHPAPMLNQYVTAGYEFFVPVRFDTDRLPVSLEEYGVGSAADVKLVEVRPHAENL